MPTPCCAGASAPRSPTGLLIAPQDLRTADPTRASEIYAGRFAFAGKIVSCDGRSPFEMEPPSDEWAETLLGFGWLRHLRAAESGITRANARALVDDWISLQGAWHAAGWQPEIVGAADHLVADPGAAPAARRRHAVLSPLPAQSHAPGALPAQDLHVDARRAAAPAGDHRAHLCGAVHGRARAASSSRSTRWLVDELTRQMLPDGGHVSRNPGAADRTAA